jgi:HAD superfamily hydrolase (TIGR01509 family)
MKRVDFKTKHGIEKIKAIIWDLDGVLIESEPYHIQAEMETFKRYGIKLTLPIAKEYFGIKLEDYFHDIVRRFKLHIPVREMIREHYNTLKRYYGEVFPIIPHAIEVLRILQDEYPMAIATSREKELAQMVLNRFSLYTYFKTIVYGEDVENGKPHPEPFLKASAQLQVEPHSIVVVEDAISGFTAARKAGMYVIARKAQHNSDLDFSAADHVVSDLREIPHLLRKRK